MLKPTGGFLDQKYTTKRLENKLMAKPSKMKSSRFKAIKAPKGKK